MPSNFPSCDLAEEEEKDVLFATKIKYRIHSSAQISKKRELQKEIRNQ